jgi:hypothetical protein
MPTLAFITKGVLIVDNVNKAVKILIDRVVAESATLDNAKLWAESDCNFIFCANLIRSSVWTDATQFNFRDNPVDFESCVNQIESRFKSILES